MKAGVAQAHVLRAAPTSAVHLVLAPLLALAIAVVSL